MVRPDRDLLGGEDVVVEMDATFIGGRTQGKRGPRYYNKTEVVIAVERVGARKLGRVRLRQIDKTHRKDELLTFCRDVIAPGTILRTDGETSYPDIARQLHLTHDPVFVYSSSEPAHDLLPAVHQVASLVKRWLTGTLHDGQAETHLAYYLDEYTFRFNRRTSRSRGLLWFRLVQQCVNTDPHPLDTLKSH